MSAAYSATLPAQGAGKGCFTCSVEYEQDRECRVSAYRIQTRAAVERQSEVSWRGSGFTNNELCDLGKLFNVSGHLNICHNSSVINVCSSNVNAAIISALTTS